MEKHDRGEAAADFTVLHLLLQAVLDEIRELRAEILATFGGSTEESAFGTELDRLEEKARSIASTAGAFLDTADH